MDKVTGFLIVAVIILLVIIQFFSYTSLKDELSYIGNRLTRIEVYLYLEDNDMLVGKPEKGEK